MECFLHILPVQVVHCLVLDANINSLSYLLLHNKKKKNHSVSDMTWLTSVTEFVQFVKMSNWSYMRSEDLGLREDWWQADIQCDVVFVDESASLPCHLVHHPCAKRGKRPAIVLGDIARIVANWGENSVCWVWNQPMGPKVLCPWVEVSGEFKNRIAQLSKIKIEIVFRKWITEQCEFAYVISFSLLTAIPLRLKILFFLLNSTMTSASCGM